MSSGHFRTSPYGIVFDGQSLNLIPGSNTYPMQMMAELEFDGYPLPWANVARGGASWTELTNGTDLYPAAPLRLYPRANIGLQTVLVLCGGTSDIFTEGDTGAEIYADMELYADNARGAGFDFVVAQTITPYNGISAGQETARDDANARILADAGNAFDDTVNLTTDPDMENPLSSYYVDGTHWTETGAGVAADLTRPVVAALLT